MRIKAVTLRAFGAALALRGERPTPADLNRWWRDAGLGVLVWFIEAVTPLRWDATARRWRCHETEDE